MMDSGNSGSMQSSSGGDDQELDSRSESISSFLNAQINHNLNHHFPAQPQPQPQHFLSHQNPNFFDPQNLDHGGGGGGQYTNDSDLIWSRGLRSDHGFSALSNSSPSLPSRQQPISFPGPSSADSAAPPAPPPQQSRNPKKRTRASRRAPTTVLTTDTTNFRQMVQEFTGIPAAPFSGGSPYSRRLDLFSAASALRSASQLDTLGPLYPLRPAANKVISQFPPSPPPPLHNPTMIDAIVPTTTITNPNNNNTSNNPNNYQLYGIPQPSLQLGANSPMNFSNLSGFLSRDGGASASAAAAQMRGNDDMGRWKSGETVRNNDGIEENLLQFDGNNMNINSGGESQNYSLNIAEKGMENASSSSAAQGKATAASWISPSD